MERWAKGEERGAGALVFGANVVAIVVAIVVANIVANIVAIVVVVGATHASPPGGHEDSSMFHPAPVRPTVRSDAEGRRQ